MPDDLDSPLAGEDRLERLCEQAMIVRDQDTDGHGFNVNGYRGLVKSDDVRARIQKLLVTGDNRLKQGVDPEKARESWEQALAVAREAGLEETIGPLVEVRLADLPPRG
jgi:hypothetical protein